MYFVKQNLILTSYHVIPKFLIDGKPPSFVIITLSVICKYVACVKSVLFHIARRRELKWKSKCHWRELKFTIPSFIEFTHARFFNVNLNSLLCFTIPAIFEFIQLFYLKFNLSSLLQATFKRVWKIRIQLNQKLVSN